MTKKSCSIALVRGAFTTDFELQNYSPLSKVKNIKINVFSSLFPLHTPTDIRCTRLPSPADLIHTKFANSIPLFTRAMSALFNRTLGDSQLLVGLSKRLSEYTILHTADTHYYYSYQCAQVKRRFPRKFLISTSWETIPFNNEKTGSKKFIKKFVQKYTDLYICHSIKAKQALLFEGVDKSRVIHMHLGIDVERFTPSSAHEKIIIFVGRLVPEKGPLVLLEAFRQIVVRYPEYRLLYVGSGPLKSTIIAKARKYKLSNKITSMKSSYNTIDQLYRKAALFVLPSISSATWEEQYGMVLLEALASGLPIIGTDSGAIPEIIGRAGFIIPQNNEEALATQMETLLGQPKLLYKHATLSRERALKHFNRVDYARKIKQLYEKHISDNSR